MLCSQIFLTVSGKLQDTREPRRWQWENTDPAAPSFLDYLNNALTQIVAHKPNATSVTVPLQLVQGFKQTIPATAGLLMNVLYNTDALGAIGSPVRQTQFKSIVRLPTVEKAGVDCYAYDKLDDKGVFWVYPHVPASGAYVMATLSNKPPVIATAQDVFPLDPKFISPAIHWILYEVYSGDNTDADLVRAQHHYEAFTTELGVVKQVDSEYPVKPKEGGR